MNQIHTPVLLKESLEYLLTELNGAYFDGTLGFGGHSNAILNKLGSNSILVATDVDLDAFGYSQKKFADDKRVRLYNFNFDKVNVISKIENIKGFNGIFADLGVSSFQLDNSKSGFTFRDNAKLDLRMNKSLNLTASELLNSFSEHEIADIIYQFGEEKNSRKISRAIIEFRKNNSFESTNDLVSVIEKLTPQIYLNKTLSRVFQALRIYINDELGVLKTFLQKSVETLLPGGRIVVLSYHSLEDRIVKEFFKSESIGCVCPKDFPVCMCNKVKNLKVLTRKPIVPTDEEIKSNYRARSAKLRAAERL